MTHFIINSTQRHKECLAFLASLAPEKVWDVEVKPYKRNRSTAQNRTMWMWLNAMSGDFGYSADDLHEVFKQKFLGLVEKTVNISRNGQVIREIMQRPKSTADLTTGEFTEYLQKIEETAKVMGFKLPYPDDYRFAMGAE